MVRTGSAALGLHFSHSSFLLLIGKTDLGRTFRIGLPDLGLHFYSLFISSVDWQNGPWTNV